MASKLFVGNLPFTTTENDLQDHFAQAGAVMAVNIMQDRATGRSRGFAFVEMASQEESTKAIAMFHQKDFQGRALTVNEARPREDRPPGGGGGGYRGGGGGGGGGYRDRR
jgi:RNA recognition motif-containing protein